MSFVISNFDDANKWVPIISGTGTIITKTATMLQVMNTVVGDLAGLVTVDAQDLTAADFRVYADRPTARTLLVIREDKVSTFAQLLVPASGKQIFAFIRDQAYGEIEIYSGYGYIVGGGTFPDPVPAGTQAEMRIVISGGQLIFYYNGQIVATVTPEGWASFPFNHLYVYCIASEAREPASSTGTPGTTTFTSAYTPPALSVIVSPASVSLQVGSSQTFAATPSGGTPPYQVQWIDNVSKVVVGTGAQFIFNATTVGTFQIFAMVTDSASPAQTVNSAVSTITVSSVPPPSAMTGCVFVHSKSLVGIDWTQVANTLAPYGISMVAIEWGGNDWMHYPSKIVPYLDCHLDKAITELHAKGIAVYADMNILLSAYIGDGIERRVMGLDYGATGLSNIKLLNYWMCPTRQASRTLLKSLVEEIISVFNVDGFVFDYIRYEHLEMCYCDECKAKFISDTGFSDVVWPADVVDTGKGGTGKYFTQFTNWRVNPVNDLVRDIRSWMLAIKPNLKFGAAVWNFAFDPARNYWKYWIGQDSAYWVSQGYLDSVSPMAYGSNLDDLANTAKVWRSVIGIGSACKLVPFITDQIDAIRTPAEVAGYVSTLMTNGADGFIIWEYGGPDITPYLQAIMGTTPTMYTLTLGVNDAIMGTTSPVPATYAIQSNASQQVSAIPQAGYMLDHWELDGVNVGSTNPYSVLMDTNHSILAVFTELPPPPPEKQHLTIVAINGQTNPAQGTYELDKDSSITVTATPNQGYKFKHWLFDNVIAGMDPTITIVMNADHTLVAVCEVVSLAPKFPVLQAGLGLLGIVGLVYLATRKG